jgi:hypothetical protein
MGGFAKGLWDWVERCVDFGASTWIWGWSVWSLAMSSWYSGNSERHYGRKEHAPILPHIRCQVDTRSHQWGSQQCLREHAHLPSMRSIIISTVLGNRRTGVTIIWALVQVITGNCVLRRKAWNNRYCLRKTIN